MNAEQILLVERGKKYARAYTAALSAVRCKDFAHARDLVKDNPPSDQRAIANRIAAMASDANRSDCNGS